MRTEYKEGDLLTKEDIGLVFKDREGYEVKIIHFSDDPVPGHQVIGISKDNIHLDFFNLNGSARDRGHAYLVSFVGPEFTEEKKLRKFEFDAYLGEDPSTLIHTASECIHEQIEHEKSCGGVIDRQFGYHTTGILNKWQVEGYFHSQYFNKQIKYKKFSKWKITMEELPND